LAEFVAIGYFLYTVGTMLLGTQKVNANGRLEIGGCDVVNLAAQFGTPLYVMDEELIRSNCRSFVQAFAREYGNSAVAYASKAFTITSMCALIAQEEMWLDVASAGELHTAKVGGFPMDRILFHGNNKSAEELEMAVEYGVKYIVADSFNELELLDAIGANAGKIIEVMIRCNPGVDPHTHRLIRTGQEDSKFGFNIKSGAAMKAVEFFIEAEHIELAGLHCHVGSQLFDLTPFLEAAPVMAGFIKQILDETGKMTTLLDLGGGLGVRYLEDHNPPSIDEFAAVVSKAVKDAMVEVQVMHPKLILEPGRSIVGEAGTTIYTVGPIKEVNIAEDPGTKTYLSIDGGLSDNPRPALYDAVYSALIANKANQEPVKNYTVAGKHCETDIMIQNIKLAEARTGDILAVQTTGAYNHAMASNYNRFTRPAVVFVKDGKADLVCRRETMDDLVKCDILPDRFRI